MKKMYKSGMVCGRFQTIHKGHETVLENAIALCETVVVLVGSVQESGTERNPFDFELREKMLRTLYPEANLVIVPLKDMAERTDETPNWGSYLMKHVVDVLGEKPTIMFSGNDNVRKRWFNRETLGNTFEFVVNRKNTPLSATLVREFMAKDDLENWKLNVNPKLHVMYDELREALMSIDFYRALEVKNER